MPTNETTSLYNKDTSIIFRNIINANSQTDSTISIPRQDFLYVLNTWTAEDISMFRLSKKYYNLNTCLIGCALDKPCSEILCYFIIYHAINYTESSENGLDDGEKSIKSS